MNEAQHKALTDRLDRIIALLEEQERVRGPVFMEIPNLAVQQTERIAQSVRRGIVPTSQTSAKRGRKSKTE